MFEEEQTQSLLKYKGRQEVVHSHTALSLSYWQLFILPV